MAAHDKSMKIRFERPESAPIRRLTDGLLDMTASTEIFEGSIMSLDDAMFVPGGLLLAANASTEFTIEICLLGANEPSA